MPQDDSRLSRYQDSPNRSKAGWSCAKALAASLPLSCKTDEGPTEAPANTNEMVHSARMPSYW
jgi:hypothetical protein